MLSSLAAPILSLLLTVVSAGSVVEKFRFSGVNVVSAGAGFRSTDALSRSTPSTTLTISNLGDSTVIRAFLYYHGNIPSGQAGRSTMSSLAGVPVTATPIGTAGSNCWSDNDISESYRADVTDIVRTNRDGDYLFQPQIGPNNGFQGNGVSLLVIVDDGDDTNDVDIVLFDGNDSNIESMFDADSWGIDLSGIDCPDVCTTQLELHVADGQIYSDAPVSINAQEYGASNFPGGSVPPFPVHQDGNLWDIVALDITAFMDPFATALNVQSDVSDDCTSLVVAMVVLPLGAAPGAVQGVPAPLTSPPTTATPVAVLTPAPSTAPPSTVPTPLPTPAAEGTTSVFSSNFSSGTDGFTYQSSLFYDAPASAYASGDYDGGMLRVLLGGINNARADDITGGWTKAFNLTESAGVVIQFSYWFDFSSDYDGAEYSEVLVSIDGIISSDKIDDYAIDRWEGGGTVEAPTWRAITLDFGTLRAGTHIVAFGGYNNKKSRKNEQTIISFDNISIETNSTTAPAQEVLMQNFFVMGDEDFNFVEDVFGSTPAASYTGGAWEYGVGQFGGNGLKVELGGVDGVKVEDMSAGWTKMFNLQERMSASIRLSFKVSLHATFDDGEFGQARLMIDNQYFGTNGTDFLAQVNGITLITDTAFETPWTTVDIALGELSAGSHNLTIGGYCNKKSHKKELASFYFDRVILQATSG